MSKTLAFDAKRAFCNHSGLGVYSRELLGYIEANYPNEDIILFTPKKKIWDSKLKTVNSSLGFLWRSFAIYFDLKKYNVTVYHGLAGELPFWIPNNVKTIVTIHDILFLKFPEDYPWIDRFIYDLKAKHACKKADYILAVSMVTKNELIAQYKIAPHKIIVIPVPAPRLPSIQAKKPHSNDYILCISSFLGRKNQELLLKAFLQIVERIAFDIVFIGSGPKLNTVKKLAQKSTYSHRIHFIQGVSDEGKFNFLRHALFSVYPSKGEGFGIPILESFLCDKLILLSDTAIHREVASDAGVYFKANSQSDLAEKLLELSLGSQTLDMEKAKRRLDVFENAKVNSALLEIYFSLIGRTPRI